MDFTESYLSIINNELKGLNLTRITDPVEFNEKQFIDSVLPFRLSKKLSLQNKLLVDIGFGGGFPCLPLIFEYGDIGLRSVGLEARGKKVRAVNLIAKKMNLHNFKGYHERVENIFFDENCIITFKAVGKIKDFLQKVKIKENCDVLVIFYKGPHLKDQEPDYLEIKNWSLIEEQSYDVGLNQRKYLVYKPTCFPAVQDKNLVKLTTLLSNN